MMCLRFILIIVWLFLINFVSSNIVEFILGGEEMLTFRDRMLAREPYPSIHVRNEYCSEPLVASGVDANPPLGLSDCSVHIQKQRPDEL